jgi:hypothetical protein
MAFSNSQRTCLSLSDLGQGEDLGVLTTVMLRRKPRDSWNGGLLVTASIGIKCLPKDEVISIFLSGLLNSGSECTCSTSNYMGTYPKPPSTEFQIAKTLLHRPHSKITLSPTVIEDICLSCSREFYDNATDGNYKVGDMTRPRGRESKTRK